MVIYSTIKKLKSTEQLLLKMWHDNKLDNGWFHYQQSLEIFLSKNDPVIFGWKAQTFTKELYPGNSWLVFSFKKPLKLLGKLMMDLSK